MPAQIEVATALAWTHVPLVLVCTCTVRLAVHTTSPSTVMCGIEIAFLHITEAFHSFHSIHAVHCCGVILLDSVWAPWKLGCWLYMAM